LAELYVSVRLFVNFFQPSFKLAEKTREGAKVYKRYHAPATQYQRLMADPKASEEVKRQVEAQCHRQWETDPPGTLNLTHRFRWFLHEGGADAEGGGADGIGGFEEARG
jgi:hypothetical protein